MVRGNRIEVADAMKLRQPAGDDRSGGKSAESVVQAWTTDGDGEKISATVCGRFPAVALSADCLIKAGGYIRRPCFLSCRTGNARLRCGDKSRFPPGNEKIAFCKMIVYF